jgi:hypothetical protein
VTLILSSTLYTKTYSSTFVNFEFLQNLNWIKISKICFDSIDKIKIGIFKNFLQLCKDSPLEIWVTTSHILLKFQGKASIDVNSIVVMVLKLRFSLKQAQAVFVLFSIWMFSRWQKMMCLSFIDYLTANVCFLDWKF